MSARQQRKKRPLKEVPYLVTDTINNRMYTRGNFLGKGGFARCYELVDSTSKTMYAGKVVSKLLLSHKHQKSKMVQEVEIHRHLSHPNIVRMYHCFEDIDNVYVLLELCARRSLMELHKRRRALTEPEARYFTHQLIQGVTFLHEKKIIHRDLKLGNLFLNNDMQLKIGDFGLATTLDFDGERKMTLCGTPNYISPEMLDKKGHSFEVDIWAIGCILYILLVGNPPFETEELKDTYARIKLNQYVVPPRLGRDATNLIKRLLAADPARRPKITEILTTPFFTEGFLPAHLPTSCLTMAPKFNVNAVSGGVDDENLMFRSPAAPRAFSRLPGAVGCVTSPTRGAGGLPMQSRALAPSHALNQAPTHTLATVPEANVPHQRQDAASVLVTEKAPGELNDYLTELFSQLSAVLSGSPQKFNEENLDDVQDPASSPIYWVSKWVDYSDRYGLGYQLCDNNIGVLFNDSTKIILNVAAEQIQYTERNNAEHYYTMQRYPPALEKKVTLLRYFCGYMNEHLLKAGQNIQKREGDELGRLPCLQTWFRTKSAIVLHLSNGTLQINFFHDHSKVIVCPLMGAATFINSDKSVATYKFSLLEEFGCPKDLCSRLKYAKVMAERLLSRNKTSQPGSLSTVNLRPQSDGRGRIIN